MQKETLRKVISFTSMICAALNMTILPVHADEAKTLSVNKVSFSEIAPYSLYLSYGEITYQRLNSSTMRVLVTTAANRDVSSLYHDVVIYKNGTLVFDDRLSGSNDTSLVTPIDIPAKSGDFFSTYVTHYVSHLGTTEHFDTHEDEIF